MQILGHCMFEEFHSPPNLLHGFVAAPLLEFVSLVFRLGFLAELRVEVDREVEKIRADARHRESVTLLSKNKGSLLANALDEACTSEDPDIPVHDVEIETTAGGSHVRKRTIPPLVPPLPPTTLASSAPALSCMSPPLAPHPAVMLTTLAPATMFAVVAISTLPVKVKGFLSRNAIRGEREGRGR